MVSGVSQYQPNVNFQREPRETAETQRLQYQQRSQETPEARRADSFESRPRATLSYLGSNIDTYA